MHHKNAKKLVGIDLENLKKRVENNPLVERIKEQILENKSSTEWNLNLDISQIVTGDKDKFEKLRNEIMDIEAKNDH